MNLQKITAPGGIIRFAASMADARPIRQDLCDRLGISKTKITIEPAEIDTKKPGLVAALNALLEAANVVEYNDDDEGDEE